MESRLLRSIFGNSDRPQARKHPILEQLRDFAEGGASGEETRNIQAHLETCRYGCLPTIQQIRGLPSDLTRVPGEIVANGLGMKFAWIPPGSYLMGSPKEEEGRTDDETQHQVTLTMVFYIGMHVVTREQWQGFPSGDPTCVLSSDSAAFGITAPVGSTTVPPSCVNCWPDNVPDSRTSAHMDTASNRFCITEPPPLCSRL